MICYCASSLENIHWLISRALQEGQTCLMDAGLMKCSNYLAENSERLLQHYKYELVIMKRASHVFTPMSVCYEVACEIAIGFQMFSCLSETSSEFHAFTEICFLKDTVWFTQHVMTITFDSPPPPVTAYHVNPDKVLALLCNACWRQECSLCCFTRAQSQSHTDIWGWTVSLI